MFLFFIFVIIRKKKKNRNQNNLQDLPRLLSWNKKFIFQISLQTMNVLLTRKKRKDRKDSLSFAEMLDLEKFDLKFGLNFYKNNSKLITRKSSRNKLIVVFCVYVFEYPAEKSQIY